MGGRRRLLKEQRVKRRLGKAFDGVGKPPTQAAKAVQAEAGPDQEEVSNVSLTQQLVKPTWTLRLTADAQPKAHQSLDIAAMALPAAMQLRSQQAQRQRTGRKGEEGADEGTPACSTHSC